MREASASWSCTALRKRSCAWIAEDDGRQDHEVEEYEEDYGRPHTDPGKEDTALQPAFHAALTESVGRRRMRAA